MRQTFVTARRAYFLIASGNFRLEASICFPSVDVSFTPTLFYSTPGASSWTLHTSVASAYNIFFWSFCTESIRALAINQPGSNLFCQMHIYSLAYISWEKLRICLFRYRNTSYLMFAVGNLTVFFSFRPM